MATKSGFWPTSKWLGGGIVNLGGATPDTFLLPRRQVLWPQLATARNGTWAWAASTNYVFGGIFWNSSTANGDYSEWANVNLFNANAKVRILWSRFTDGGIAAIYWNGVKYGELDTYGGAAQNLVTTIDLGTVPAGRGTLRIIAEGKNISSSAYRIQIQQVEIVQPTGSNLGTSIDDLPWFGDAPPIFAFCEYWNGSAWVAHAPSPVQDTAAQWGSYVPFGHANNWRATIRFWAPQGLAHTLNLRHRNSTAGGTITATLNGAATTPGTFSTSAGGTTYNNSTNLTFTAATTGMQELRLTGNGGVACNMQWISWRKTVALGAITPTGQTYGVESLELYPWFADTISPAWSISTDSLLLHNGQFGNNNTLDASLVHNIGAPAGSWALTYVTTLLPAGGLFEVQANGAAFGSATSQDSGTTRNHRLSIAGSIGSPFSSLTLTAKDGGPAVADYRIGHTLAHLERTGA